MGILERIEQLLRDILAQLILQNQAGRPITMKLLFKGGILGMPGKETDVQTIPCTALEFDAAGNPVALNPATVTWAIEDTTIAQLTQNADGSATFKALKVGTTNVTCTDSGVTPPVVGSDTLTVTAGPDAKMTLQFGIPTP